jgi:hypothetical protein
MLRKISNILLILIKPCAIIAYLLSEEKIKKPSYIYIYILKKHVESMVEWLVIKSCQ